MARKQDTRKTVSSDAKTAKRANTLDVVDDNHTINTDVGKILPSTTLSSDKNYTLFIFDAED